MQSTDPKKRETAAHMLKRYGKRGLPLLKKALRKDPDQRVRRAAARTLGRLRYSAGIAALQKGLRDKHWTVRRECVLSLGLMGAPAHVASRDLLHAWGDDYWQVRGEVPRAWKAVGLSNNRALRAFTNGLTLPRWRSRVASAVELGKMGTQARAAEPRLVTALSHKRPEVRVAVATALGRVGKSPDVALVKALTDSHHTVRAAAAKALGGRKKVSPAAIEALAALDDSKSEVNYAAGVALVHIGEQAVPVLVQLLAGPWGNPRRRAFRLLGEMGPKAKSAVGALIAVLKSEKKDYGKELACAALERIGPAAGQAVPALMQTLLGNNKGDRNLFNAAARALGRMGPPAVAPLLKALTHESTFVRMRAANALGRNGIAAKDAVRPLSNALRTDKETWVREYSALALGDIGIASAAVKSALVHALRDSYPEVRGAARKALAKLATPTRSK
jgi:HEAT repeat protein